MHLSARTMYAVRALVYLAMLPANAEPVRVETIAEAQGIPPRFLSQIMATLKAAGMVMSRRGTAGGYALTRSASAITLAEVIARFEEGLLAPTSPTDDPVGIALRELAERVDAVLRDTTIEQLAARSTSDVPRFVI